MAEYIMNSRKKVSFALRILRKVKNRLLPCVIMIRKILNLKTEYHYNSFSILLPADHMLPIHQKHHAKYDKFLPHLARYIEGSQTIIDIGANCGDTLAGMIEANQNSTYICVEPDDVFFQYLEANIVRIKNVHKSVLVHAVKSLVGNSITNVSLAGVGGTKHAVVDAKNMGGHLSESLDKIYANLKCPNIRLLKTDVDGFDYDVIDSAQSMLTSQHPMIFFECLCDFDYQRLGYQKTVRWLETIGYSDWTVFDNFGEVVIRTKDIEQVLQLMGDVSQQNIQSATKMISYYDILAITNKDTGLIDEVLKGY